ncbi:MAG: alpha/beta fold hydrolase [bacterium]
MSSPAIEPTRVVLLHGLGRSTRSMLPIERALRRRGGRVLNLGYPSRSADVATLAADVARQIIEWEPNAPLDFITHSLGGIVLRMAVAQGDLPSERIRRAVMLGPPNSGSELADALPKVRLFGPLYRRFTGPAGLELGVGPEGVPAQLPPVSFELGVIAGTRSMNPVFNAMLSEPNDGKVRVERTKVKGMRDFLLVPEFHPLMMAAPDVITQAIHFLDFGAFRR